MADNYLPPINLDFGGLTLPKPGEVPSEAYRRLQGDGSIPPGTPPEVADMLDDTGGDPALDPPQVFSDKNASQLKQAPDPADPLAAYDFTKQPPPEAMAPAWAMKGPDVNPEQRKRNAGQFDPTMLDKIAASTGIGLGWGRMSPSESQQEQAQRQKELEDARKTVTDQILFQGSQALDGPVEQPPVNQQVLEQNVNNAAPVQQKAKVASQAPPNLAKWRDFTERSLQSFLTGIVAVPRAGAIAADVPRAIGATIRGNKNLDQNAAAEKLQKVTEDIQAAIPGDPARSSEFVSQLGNGSGSMASFLIGGAAAKGLGLSVKAGSMVAGAAVGGVQGFDDARMHSAPTAARYLSFVVGSGLGTTEAIPIDRAFYWLNQSSGGAVSRIVATTAINGLTELIQEVGQQIGQNLTAKTLYDHSREIFDGVADAGTVAFVIGSMFGLGMHASRAVNNRLGLGSPQKAQEAPPTGSEAPTQPAGAENPPAGQKSQPEGALAGGAGPLAGATAANTSQAQQPTLDPQLEEKYLDLADEHRQAFNDLEDALGGPSSDLIDNVVEMQNLSNSLPKKQAGDLSSYPQGLTVDETIARAAEIRDELAAELDQQQVATLQKFLEVDQQLSDLHAQLYGVSQQAQPRADQTRTDEFKRWFGGSKAVDAGGKPLVVYHGTNSEFTSFDKAKAVKGLLGPGFYFTTSKEQAAGYGKNVIAAYLRIDNPRSNLGGGMLPSDNAAHDGAIVEGTPGTKPGERVFFVKDPTQIKSATGNSGAFDGSNPDITAMRSPQRPAPAYPLERTRPATGIPEQQNVAPAEQTSSKRDIADRFKDAIDLVVKQGRFGKANSKAEAIYKWGQSVARVKSQGQLLELFHEGGHHLHAILEPLLNPVIAAHDAEVLKIADTLYGGGGQIALSDVPLRRKEGFATFFQVYMNNPAEARVIAPAFLPAFEAVLEQDRPGIKSELEAIRKDVDAWLLSKSSAQLARERVISSRQLGTIGKIVESIKGGTVLHDVATLANRVYQATLDESHPLTLAVRRLKVVAEENIRTQIERGLIAKDQALAALAKLDRRGRANPVKMAVLARNAYHASSEMIASGIAKYDGDGTPVSKGLTEILHSAMGGTRLDPVKYQDFNTYLAMRRIITEWQNYYATLKWDNAQNYGPASNNAGAQEPPVKRFRRPDDVSLGDAQQAVADLLKANPQFAEAAGELYVYLDELLQYKVDAGIISQKTADAQRQVADYVPLRREMDDTKSGTLGKSKDARTGKDNLIRVFRGSDRRILSPVESIMQMTHETVALVAKNDVKRSLVQMALDVGRGSGAVVEQIPASQMKGTSVNIAEVLKAAGDFSLAEEIAQAMGRDEITMQEFMDEVLDGDEVGTVWRKADITEKGEPIVYTWRNGEIEAYQLNDAEWADDLYNSLTELGKEQTNLAIQILGKPAAALRAGVTTSPPFLIANLVRDQLGAWVLNDGVYPVAGLAKGLASDLFDRKARRLYNLSMASIGGSNVAALDKTRFGTEQTMLAKAGVGVTAEQSLNTALRVLDSTETFSRQGIWQAAFKKAQADGLNVADAMIEAGYEASDYANYGRAGSKMLLARRLVTFLNANLQGLDKSLRVALGGEGGGAFLRKQLAPWVRRQISPAAASRIGLEGSQTSLPLTVQEKQQLARAGRTLSKMMMLAIPSMLLAMLYRDDEEYQDFSPYLKGTRWMVKIAPGKWLAIPKPFQLATFATFVEYSSDAILHGDPTAMQKFMQSQAAVIAPPYENPAIKQFYELATNTDMFSGRPIVSPAVGARPAWLQYDEYTSEFSKAMGRFTGASPMIVDHVITSSFATWGRGFLSASNLLNPDRPAQGLDDFAFTSYFVKDGSRSSTVRPAFLELVGQTQGKLTGAYSGYKALMDGGADGQAKDLLDNLAENQKVFALLYYHQEADAKKLHPLRNAYDIVQTISGLRKELVVNRVREGGKDDGEIITLSPSQQKLLNDRLSDLQVRVQRNALVATGEPGFANRKILPTFPLVEEIKAIDPRIAADLKTRMGSRIYTTDAVTKLWPKVQAELLANGPKANLRPFVMKAKAAGNKIWTNGGTE